VHAIWREILSGCRALERSPIWGRRPRSRIRRRAIASAARRSWYRPARSARSSTRSSATVRHSVSSPWRTAPRAR
jgi:hypothetical protein